MFSEHRSANYSNRRVPHKVPHMLQPRLAQIASARWQQTENSPHSSIYLHSIRRIWLEVAGSVLFTPSNQKIWSTTFPCWFDNPSKRRNTLEEPGATPSGCSERWSQPDTNAQATISLHHQCRWKCWQLQSNQYSPWWDYTAAAVLFPRLKLLRLNFQGLSWRREIVLVVRFVIFESSVFWGHQEV